MGTMEYDRNKVDDMTLALLWLTAFEQSPRWLAPTAKCEQPLEH